MGRVLVSVLDMVAAELLPVQSYLDVDRVVLKACVSMNVDVSQQVLVHRRACASTPSKLPAWQWLPTRDGQVADQ